MPNKIIKFCLKQVLMKACWTLAVRNIKLLMLLSVLNMTILNQERICWRHVVLCYYYYYNKEYLSQRISYRFCTKQEGSSTCVSVIIKSRSSIVIIARCFIPHKTRLRSQTLFLACSLPTTLSFPSNRLFVIWVIFFWCPSNSIILEWKRGA